MFSYQMQYDIQSITDHWETISIEDSNLYSLQGFGSTDQAFSGGIEWSTSDGISSALVVNGFAVRTSKGLPVQEDNISIARVREAPTPELPYIVALHNKDNKLAQYYTKDVPIEKAIKKIKGSGFSGYIELSDRIYSGDYYAVFSAGTVGYIGLTSNERPPLTGRDAKKRMIEEIGNYTVHKLSIDSVDLSRPRTERGEPRIYTETQQSSVSDTRVFTSNTDPADSTNETNVFSPEGRGNNSNLTSHDNDSNTSSEKTVYKSGAGPGVSIPNFCPNCGKELDDKLKTEYCPECGTYF